MFFGRGDDCQVRLTDPSVSRTHARIDPGSDGRYHVRDLGSTNGTFVNNIQQSESPLADGDYLRIGNCIFRFLTGGNLEAEYHEEIYRLTILDALTGIPNRRTSRSSSSVNWPGLLAIAAPAAGSSGRGSLQGHQRPPRPSGRRSDPAPDRPMRRALIRKDELMARYGGEEFAVVLPELDPVSARTVCERVRQSIEDHEFAFGQHTYRVTVSIGIGVMLGDEAATVNELVRRADAMLYQAKQCGRNRVCSE